MLTVDESARIRLAHRDGMSVRELARTYGHSRHTIRKVLCEATPKGYTLSAPRSKRKLTESFQEIINEILETDKCAPKKQRHTAKRIFDRLRDEHGFVGGYDCVRRYVKSQRTETRETFLPISSAAGQRAEADFGQIEVDFPDGRRTVSVLLITWSYSNAVFAIALPSEKVEAILRGTVEAFSFFGCVPRELWWDNPKTVATAILKGRHRELNPSYQALASHYNFEPLFCQPARGNEKPHVEGRVKWMKQNWATPVPCFRNLEELNAYLRRCCEHDQARTVTGKEDSIAERFAQEKPLALPLPTHAFDDCVSEARSIDKYQTFAWEGNRYSVPRRDAFSNVVVKAYVDRLEVFRDHRRVACHSRTYGKHQMVLEPLHYLTLLARKPAYLDHTEVYKTWELPREFIDLREHFEQQHGIMPGSRQFIQVLQLLAKHSQDRVLEAIRVCQREGVVTAQRVIFRCEELDDNSRHDNASIMNDTPRTLPRVEVPLPDLSRFDVLLASHQQHHANTFVDVRVSEAEASFTKTLTTNLSSETQGGVKHDQEEAQHEDRPGGDRAPVAQVQPEATSPADDVGRAREARAGSCRHKSELPRVSSPFDGIGAGNPSLQCTANTHPVSGFSRSEGTRFV